MLPGVEGETETGSVPIRMPDPNKRAFLLPLLHARMIGTDVQTHTYETLMVKYRAFNSLVDPTLKIFISSVALGTYQRGKLAS